MKPGPRPFTLEQSIAAFWAKVKNGPVLRPELGPCWIWTGAKTRGGYGTLRRRPRGSIRAHRFAWEITYGELPRDVEACHLCDNPPCVRPDHLFRGTKLENMQDCSAKGRAFAHGPELRPGAKLTPDQVAEIRQKYLAGGVLQRELAAQFGVNQQSVSNIVRGETWEAANAAGK